MALLLDMLALKAANADAVFEDQIWQHSTSDWEKDDDLEGSKSLSFNARSLRSQKIVWASPFFTYKTQFQFYMPYDTFCLKGEGNKAFLNINQA